MAILSRVILCVGLVGFTPALAEDPALDSAVYLLKRATQSDNGQMRHLVLRALRQMQDPKLEPLFAELVQSDDPLMRVHGILGLAEIARNRQINLELVRTIEKPLPLARLITAAVDDELINVETARELLSWPTLDPSVRAVLAARLVSTGEIKTAAEVETLFARSDSVALKCVTELLKAEVSQQPLMSLRSLSAADPDVQARITAMLLAIAMRFELGSVGPWAVSIAVDTEAEESLRLLALRAGLRYTGEPGQAAIQSWWADAEGDADRMRLALVALDAATHVRPEFFRSITKTATDLSDPTDRVLNHIAKVGGQIAEGKPDSAAIVALIETDHIPSARWALRYVESLPTEVAQPVLVALIEAGDREGRFRGQRLEHVVLATERLFNVLGEDKQMITDMLGKLSPVTQEAMLMGLVRVRAGDPSVVVADRNQWPTQTAGSMALLIEAKHQTRLTEDQLTQLSRVVRGGGGLLLPLRTQAAWLYLDRTQQQRNALATILQATTSAVGN